MAISTKQNVVFGPLLGKPNVKKLSRIYSEAFNQINQLWESLPQSFRTSLRSESSNEVPVKVIDNNKKIELEEQVNSLKGKQNSFKNKVVKKRLKNQLKKKKKTEEKKLVKQELKQKKKELREKKYNKKIMNGDLQQSGSLETKVDEVLKEIDSDSDNSSLDISNNEFLAENKTNIPRKITIEEIATADDETEKNDIQKIGLSKKKLKLMVKNDLKMEKKREKRKLIKLKKKELALAEAQLLKETVQDEKKEDIKPNIQPPSVTFNKMEFEEEKRNMKKSRFKKNNKFEKDPVKALAKIEELNQKLTDLKSTGQEEKAAAIKSKDSWKKAILKADGVKVKDNVKLLKKTILKQEKKKNKSKTEWAKRKEMTDKMRSEAQKKRTENIKKKKKEKKQKKIKKSIKKGRIVI